MAFAPVDRERRDLRKAAPFSSGPARNISDRIVPIRITCPMVREMGQVPEGLGYLRALIADYIPTDGVDPSYKKDPFMDKYEVPGFLEAPRQYSHVTNNQPPQKPLAWDSYPKAA